MSNATRGWWITGVVLFLMPGPVLDATEIPIVRFKNGDLVEALHFKRIFCRTYHEELAIVVRDANALGGARAFALFTFRGKVMCRFRGREIAVPDLVPIDLRSSARITGALRLMAPLAEDGGPMPEKGNDLDRAYSILTDLNAVGVVPVAKTRWEGSEVVVFDWNREYHVYDPSTGVRSYPIPRDLVTGEPYLCIKHGEVLEARKFYYDYLRKFPGEKAAMLIHRDETISRSYAATAYTSSGQLKMFSPLLGHIDVPKTYSITMEAALDSYHNNLVFDKLMRGETIVPAVPTELPGDQEDRPVLRAYQMLAGNRIMEKSGPVQVMAFKWDGFNFFFHRTSGITFYGGFSYYQISPLVENLLFRTKYLRDNPSEEVVIVHLPEILERQRFPFTLAAYSKGDRVFMYDAIVGHVPLDGGRELLAAKNRQALTRQCDHANIRVYREQKEIRAMGYEPNPYPMEEMATETVYDTFKKAGIPAELIPTRIWREDGSLSEYAAPAVKFTWEGQTYTYNSEFGAYRTDGYFEERVGGQLPRGPWIK